MDDALVYQKALELLSADYGRLAGSWRLAQAQALGLQDEVRRLLARIQELESHLPQVPDDGVSEDSVPEVD